MKSFIAAFYLTIFLTLLAISKVPSDFIHQMMTAPETPAVIIPQLCKLFMGAWLILTGITVFLSCLDFSFVVDGFLFLFRKATIKWGSSRSIRTLLIFAFNLALTGLSACTSSVETQHDGSGSDLMLKSPCACNPIPYSPPGFKWNGKVALPSDRGDG